MAELKMLTPRVLGNFHFVKNRFPTIADFDVWVDGISQCNGFKEKKNSNGQVQYLLGALFNEIKEMKK